MRAGSVAERRHLSPRTIDLLCDHPAQAARAYRSRINSFFKWCINNRGIVRFNPCREITLPRPKSKKSRWTDALYWAAHARLGPMQQIYHELSFLLYQRTTDVRLLKRADIGDTAIHIAPSKTLRSSGLEVDIPITPAIRAVLERAAALRTQWKIISPYVICTRQGTAFTRSAIYQAYKRADTAIHTPAADLHNPARHIRAGLNPKALLPFAVTAAKARGYTTEQIQLARAHASITTTEGYIQHHGVPVSELMLELPHKPPGVSDKS